MNRMFIGFLAVAALAAFSFTAPVANKSINTQLSDVVWKAYKVTGEHTGHVKLKSGSLQFDGDRFTGGSFVVDMTSISCTDLQGEWAGKLVGHLKSPDFFNVAEYPDATFVITQVISRGTPGSYKVTGNMKIKEHTKAVRFNVQFGEEGGAMTATADIKLDRTDYDVRYGSGSFFDGLGDKTIYDEFDLQIKLVANK